MALRVGSEEVIPLVEGVIVDIARGHPGAGRTRGVHRSEHMGRGHSRWWWGEVMESSEEDRVEAKER